MEKQLLSMLEVEKLLGHKRYTLLSIHGFPARLIGKRWYVSKPALDKWLEKWGD